MLISRQEYLLSLLHAYIQQKKIRRLYNMYPYARCSSKLLPFVEQSSHAPLEVSDPTVRDVRYLEFCFLASVLVNYQPLQYFHLLHVIMLLAYGRHL